MKQVLATRWQLTVEHDYGWSTATAGKAGSEWYGIAGYLKYEFDPGLALGLRLEWFRDDDGVRVGVPARHPDTVGHASDYFETTLGLNWRPLPWMILRPSVRYDYSADWQAFSNNTRNDQVLLMSDVIIYF